ncbi:homoserine dehydrogenase [Roseivirga pacifica]|uniref:homoserine dehydrogenase n=1 Tax=Roseivirga pacifica TaxID=1267423 RepID=UPI003BAC6A2C
MQAIKIGLFGYGCVGQGLYETINNSKNFEGEIKKICIKNPNKARSLSADLFTTDKNEILNDESIDVIVELIDDAEAAFDIVTTALKNGKSVVTANKKMVAENLKYLVKLQEETGRAVLYEGAVCASIPIIRTLEEYFGHEPINEIKGIFNGSTNYILTQIFSKNTNYKAALADAQKLGFAESDPTLDVKGYDAKFKLSILLTHAFGINVPPAQIINLGIDHLKPADLEYARENELEVKLIARAKRIGDKVYGFVAPQFTKADNRLQEVRNEFNAVSLTGEFCDEQLFIGKGAGSLPTGAAVLSDISALSYDYKYEYKKHFNQATLKFSSDSLVQVYASFDNPDTIDLNDFESIHEKYFSFDHSYVIGNVCINKLKDEKWLNNKNLNVVLCENGVEDTLGKLCVEDLKAEVSELKKGHDLLVKISR